MYFINNLVDKFLDWFVDVGIDIIIALLFFIGIPLLVVTFFYLIPSAEEVFGR